MKKTLLAIAALAFMAWGCGSEEEVIPSLQQGWNERPTNWVAPDNSSFDLPPMSVQVQLGDTLAAYQSSADLMCATINGEIRAVTPPMSNMGVVYYPLTIVGNSSDQMVCLHYYCDRLHRIYTIENWAQFDPSTAPTGDSGIYRPKFAEK